MWSQKKETVTPDLEYFTVYDSKAQSYRPPMAATNSLDMVRQLDNLFRDPNQAQNQLLVNAEDFQLFKVGAFFKATGELKTHAPEHVANLHEIRASVPKSDALAQLVNELRAQFGLTSRGH